MKKYLYILITLLVLTAALTAAVSADELYTFELSEATHISDLAENWYMDLSIPQVKGLADKTAENSLNAYFMSWKDYVIKEYNDDVEFMEEEYSTEDLPHFGYEYNWEKVVDSDDYFVFKTYLFYAAGSSMTVSEYWTLDKHSGSLIELLDVADKVRLEEVRSMIKTAMDEENKTQEVFWTEEDIFDAAFSYIEEYHHWYINEKGNLVITFDKYEVAPGTKGESRFEITGDKAVLLKDNKYSFDLYVGDTAEITEKNWYLNLKLPVIRGLADIDQENQMNAHFVETFNGIRKEFETAVATAEESISEDDGPHFGYEYFYEILADTPDYFAFKTVAFFAAGSSMTKNEFWTLDKNTGKLVTWEDVVTPEMVQGIHDQILAEMTDANGSGTGLYYTDDESFGFAFANVPAYHHWYLNENGDLVICFDKYEIAVGAQGAPEFIIKR